MMGETNTGAEETRGMGLKPALTKLGVYSGPYRKKTPTRKVLRGTHAEKIARRNEKLG